MTDHSFRLRLSCRYEKAENTVAALGVQNWLDDEWQDFNLDFGQPGFLIFVYAILNCQHLYMRTNAAEQGLLLDSALASIDVLADEEWRLQKLHVQFEVKLRSGSPAREDIDYIIDRMQHCPVSTNLKDVPDTRTVLKFSPVETG